MLNTPLQMFLVRLAGWMNEQQRAANAYLKEENRVLRELHGNRTPSSRGKPPEFLQHLLVGFHRARLAFVNPISECHGTHPGVGA